MISRTTYAADGYDGFTLDLWLIAFMYDRLQEARWVVGIPPLGVYLALSKWCGRWRLLAHRIPARPMRTWLIVRPPLDRLMRILRVGKVDVDLIAANDRIVADVQAALTGLHPLTRKVAVWELHRFARRGRVPWCLAEVK